MRFVDDHFEAQRKLSEELSKFPPAQPLPKLSRLDGRHSPGRGCRSDGLLLLLPQVPAEQVQAEVSSDDG